MTAAVAAWAAAGAVAGAVGIGWGHRVDKVDPVGWPCPACDGRQGLPRTVLPWVVPARCPVCRRTVRGPTAAVELAAAAGLGALAASGEGTGLLVARAWLVVVLAALVWTDARYRLLPGSIVWAGGVGSVVLLGAVAQPLGSTGSLTRAVASAAVAGAVVLALHLVSPAGLAYGDVRLCALLGLHLGWGSASAPAWTLVLASAAGAGWGLLRGGGRRGVTLPFGPFLAAASVVVLVASAGG